VIACWKHNLDFGAEAEVYGGPDAEALPAVAEDLAVRACSALRLVYGAVDIVELEADAEAGGAARWAVLEVNACPAWNHFLATHAQKAAVCIGKIVAAGLRLQLT
jgi:glutathione synthase/RimK-type ligase-like ATP-grasp enzyme